MGLLSLGQTVLTEYKIDTKDARAQVRKLAGEEKKRARAALDGLDDQNKKIEGHIATIGKIGIAVGGIVGAWAIAKKGLDEFTKRTQLQAAASGASIHGIQQAAKGLITEMDALTIAASLQNGAFEINQAQMEVATKAMISLRNQGNDLVEVQKEVTKALVEGNAEGLKKFGLVIKTETGTIKAFRDIMQGLEQQLHNTKAELELPADDFVRAAVRMQDAQSRLSAGIGKLATNLAPLIEGLGSLVDALVEITDATALTRHQELDKLLEKRKVLMKELNRESSFLISKEKLQNDLAQTNLDIQMQRLGIFKKQFQTQEDVVEAMEKSLALLKEIIPKQILFFKLRGETEDDDEFTTPIAEVVGRGPVTRLTGEAVSGLGSRGALSLQAHQPLLEQSEAIMKAAEDRIKIHELEEALRLDQLRRERDELRKNARATQIWSDVSVQALDMFSGAAAQAFGAWIDGSEAAGQSTKKFIFEALKSIATQLLATSIQEGVLALVALARPIKIPGEAAGHLRAAAAAASGAVVIGGMARALGPGVSSAATIGSHAATPGTGGAQFGNVGTTRQNLGRDFRPFIFEAPTEREPFREPLPDSPLQPSITIIETPETIGTRTPQQQALDTQATIENAQRRFGSGRRVLFQ